MYIPYYFAVVIVGYGIHTREQFWVMCGLGALVLGLVTSGDLASLLGYGCDVD